jgi:propanol-preferring alcohol dehydrogenase
MHAMILDLPSHPLREGELDLPALGPGEVEVRVRACGVCRTDLHLVDGELQGAKLPLVPGHEIAGTIERVGERVDRFTPGDRVGVPWLGWTCGECRFCRAGRENLCEHARFTGYQIDGGYAERAIADARFVFPLPPDVSDAQAAPLLCAGLIGYRSWAMVRSAERVGIYGFGAAAHIVAQVVRWAGQRMFVFTKSGDQASQTFALELGAEWVGDSETLPPEPLDAAIIFAPVGALVPAALRAVEPGGTVVCGGIHMSDLPAFPYRLLWGERIVRSVANLTRKDGLEFLSLARTIPIRTRVETFPLRQANEALMRLRLGQIQGAAVLVP